MRAEEEKAEERNEAPAEEKQGGESPREETGDQAPGKETSPAKEEPPDPPEEQEEEKAGASAGTEGTEKADEDIGDDDQVEEEVVLDEADPGEEKLPEPDTAAPEEETAEETAREEKSGNGKQAPEKGHGKKGVRALLRKKWVLLSGGIVLLGLGISFVSLGGDRGKTLSLALFLGGQGKEDESLVQTVLKPFFIPLSEDAQNAAIMLVISAKWDAETLSRYKRKSVVIRDELYRYLVQAAKSGKDMVKQKSALAPGLNQVLRHALTAKRIEVRVDKVSLI